MVSTYTSFLGSPVRMEGEGVVGGLPDLVDQDLSLSKRAFGGLREVGVAPLPGGMP